MTILHSPRVARANRLMTTLGLTTILASGFVAAEIPAYGQTEIEGPRFVNVDDNGVDLSDLSFNFTINEGSIGAGESVLPLIRNFGAAGWSDGYSNRLSRSTVGGQTQVRISDGRTSVTFTKVGSVFVPANADGSTLTEVGSGNSYVYTKANGDKLDFPARTVTAGPSAISSTLCSSTVTTSCFLPMGSHSKPNGMKTIISWSVTEKCYRNGVVRSCSDDSLPFTNIIRGVRVSRVSNSVDYSIDFAYATNVFTPGASVRDWYRRTSATFKDGATTAATVGYAYPTSTTTQTTDMGGRVWNFTYAGTNDGGALTAIQRPGATANNVTIAYTPSLSAVTIDGVTANYSRSVSGTTATTTVTNALSGVKTAVTDLTLSRVTKITDELSRITTYAYDTSARLTDVTLPEGNKIITAYDARGNVASTTYRAKVGSGLSDIVTTADYSASCTNIVVCNKPTWTKDAKLNQTDYTYDPTHGGLLTVTAPAATSGGVRPQTRYNYAVTSGVTMLTGISACQSLASCAGAADETKVTATYNTKLLPSTITKASGDGATSSTISYTYDILGNQASADGPLPGTADTVIKRYDAARQLVGVIAPDPDGAGTRAPTAQRFAYNNDGQVTLSERGTVTDQTDPAWANFSSQEQVAVTYDANGRPVKSESKAGGTTYTVAQTSYDALGRVDCVAIRMDPAQWASQSTACSSQTTGPNGPDRVTKTIYDAASQITQVQVGIGTSAAANEATYTWSSNGQKLSAKDGENNLTSYEYDGFDRLAKSRYPSPAQGSGTSSTTDYEQLSYDPNGNVTSRRLRDGQTVGYGYDNLNRVTNVDLPNTAYQVLDKALGYDLLGRLTSATVTNDLSISFVYDALGRQVQENGGFGNVARTFDAAGRMTSETLPGGGLTVNYDYDVAGNTTAVRENGATSGVGVLASYSYDNLGRRTGVTFGNGTSQTYTYDAVSRLSSLGASLPAAPVNGFTNGFTYNPASQIASTTRSNDGYAWNGHYNVDRSYGVNGLNQMTAAGPTSLGYDGRGNLTASGSNSFTYGPENLMETSSVGGVTRSLAYDAVGRLSLLTGTFSNSIRFQYSGSRLVSERDWYGNLLRRYVHGPGTDQPIVWYEGTGASDRRFLIADERGSVVSVTDNAGAFIGKNSYDEYGIPAPGNIGRFGYTGQTWLPELGMWYYKARIYSPTLGRFMQTDPIGYHDGMNWYNYVGSDPINSVDSSGLSADEEARKCLENCPPIVVTGNRGWPSPPVRATREIVDSVSIVVSGTPKKPKPPPPAAKPQKPDTKDRTREHLNRLADLKKKITACPPPASSSQCKPLWDEYDAIMNTPEMKIVKENTADQQKKLLSIAFGMETGMFFRGPIGAVGAGSSTALGIWFDEIWAWANGY